MKEKLPILIKNLEKLKSEIEFDFDGQMVELEHEYSVSDNPNSYSLELYIRRPRHFIDINDKFVLTINEEEVTIDYCRKTKSIIPVMTKSIPDVLERRYRYDINNRGEVIFKNLMKDITKFFAEYKYVDKSYKFHGEENDDIF
ncbi:hypothetical protein [Aquiflexum sp.]|uniref:hypothetical protein n=1 Tax=Aquiflexum sp. TaxID=1872584 RepID=UPI003593FA13